MAREYRQTVMIGSGGTFEGCAPDLEPGKTAEVVALFPEGESVSNREIAIEKMRVLRTKAIAEGMELWDLDRINQEVATNRYGDREIYR